MHGSWSFCAACQEKVVYAFSLRYKYFMPFTLKQNVTIHYFWNILESLNYSYSILGFNSFFSITTFCILFIQQKLCMHFSCCENISFSYYGRWSKLKLCTWLPICFLFITSFDKLRACISQSLVFVFVVSDISKPEFSRNFAASLSVLCQWISWISNIWFDSRFYFWSKV